MPFTLSHAALVLPATFLPKKTYSLTGLIVGSFVPDFEYFIRMRNVSLYSHTLPGILWFDLPLGILLAFLYHYLVRDALLENLPKSLYRRLSQFKSFNWLEYFKINWLVIIISIIVGTASHIFWDSFTHSNGYFVKLISMLREHIMILGITFPFYKISQHLSTVVGGIVIIFSLYKMPENMLSIQNTNKSYWIFVCIISLAIFALRVSSGHGYGSFNLTIVNVISCGLMALIIAPFFIKATYQKDRSL